MTEIQRSLVIPSQNDNNEDQNNKLFFACETLLNRHDLNILKASLLNVPSFLSSADRQTLSLTGLASTALKCGPIMHKLNAAPKLCHMSDHSQ